MPTFYDYMLNVDALTLDRVYSREEIQKSICQRSFLDDAYDRFHLNAYTEYAYKECADPRMLALLLEKTPVQRAWPVIQAYVESWLWPSVIQTHVKESKGDMLHPYVNIIATLQRTNVPLSDLCTLPPLWCSATQRVSGMAAEELENWLNSVVTAEELTIYPSM